MKIIGIDPGLSGAIAVLENNKAVIKETSNGTSLFALPRPRPKALTDISLTNLAASFSSMEQQISGPTLFLVSVKCLSIIEAPSAIAPNDEIESIV